VRGSRPETRISVTLCVLRASFISRGVGGCGRVEHLSPVGHVHGPKRSTSSPHAHVSIRHEHGHRWKSVGDRLDQLTSSGPAKLPDEPQAIDGLTLVIGEKPFSWSNGCDW
jgi:hypothetical protein